MRALQLLDPLKQTNYELFAPARIVLSLCIHCLRVKTDSQKDFVRSAEESVEGGKRSLGYRYPRDPSLALCR